MISRECFIIHGVLNSMELRFESIAQFSSRQEVKPVQAGATSCQCAAWVWVGCGWHVAGVKEVSLQIWEAGYMRRMGNIVGNEEGCGLNLWQRKGWSRSLGEVHRGLIVSLWDWWCGKRNSEVISQCREVGGHEANEKERHGLMM